MRCGRSRIRGRTCSVYPMTLIWLTSRRIWRAHAQCRVHALHTAHHQSCVETMLQSIHYRFASPTVFRRAAPEPCRASDVGLLGDISPASHGKFCACVRGVAIGLAPLLRGQQAPRVAGGAGRTSPHAQGGARHRRAEGAPAPEAMECGIISPGYNARPRGFDTPIRRGWPHKPIPWGHVFGGSHV